MTATPATPAATALCAALDAMTTNWILSRRRDARAADADAVMDLFIDGARQR